jgi:PilZ domain
LGKSDERRNYSRYPASQLKVAVKSLRQPQTGWEDALITAVDFNRHGIALETGHNFTIGDILLLFITTDDDTLAKVNGLVCNRTLTERGFRFGIRFEHQGHEDEQSPEAMINISEEILLIEKEAARQVH